MYVRQAPAVYVGAAADVVLRADREALARLAMFPGEYVLRRGRRVKRRRSPAEVAQLLANVERMRSYVVSFGGERETGREADEGMAALTAVG